MNAQQSEDIKRPYQKPQVRSIELDADEVLAVGCKTTGVEAFGNPTSCILNNCVSDGS
jgi:hypothetical protein